jgi:hypothetical protein
MDHDHFLQYVSQNEPEGEKYSSTLSLISALNGGDECDAQRFDPRERDAVTILWEAG